MTKFSLFCAWWKNAEYLAFPVRGKVGVNSRVRLMPDGYGASDPNGEWFVGKFYSYDKEGMVSAATAPYLNWDVVSDTWFGVIVRIMLIPTLVRKENPFYFWQKWRLGGKYRPFWDEFSQLAIPWTANWF